MGAAVRLREDFSAAELRLLAKRAEDPGKARRLLSLAAVLAGMNRKAAAAIGAMDRQTLRDWVHRFNEKGPEGLVNAKAPGPTPKLSLEQKQELQRIVEANPDPDKDGVVRWRCVDLRRIIKERFDVDLDEVSVGRTLKELGFSHLSPRPQHPKQDPEAIEDCPARDTGAALVLPFANTGAMQHHLNEISRGVTHGAHAVLALDKAGWHTTRKLRMPCNI